MKHLKLLGFQLPPANCDNWLQENFLWFNLFVKEIKNKQKKEQALNLIEKVPFVQFPPKLVKQHILSTQLIGLGEKYLCNLAIYLVKDLFE